MKIYPSVHEFKEVETVALRDIPLAYVDTSNTEQVVSVAKEPAFANNTSESVVRAYDEFDSPEAYLFNSNSEIIKDLVLKRLGNRYIYEPQNAVEFTPLQFSFNALVKKNMTYRNDKNYNLKVAVHEEDSDLTFSKLLIAIFGDAPRRGICPANISINNMAMTPDSLINTSYADNDMLFIKSSDGYHYKEVTTATTSEPVAETTIVGTTTNTVTDGNVTTKTTKVVTVVGQEKTRTTTVVTTTIKELDMGAILDANTNVWLCVDTFGNMITTQTGTQFALSNPTLYKNKAYTIKNYTHYFNKANAPHDKYPTNTYTYSYPFDDSGAAVILEKANGGFIIVTHSAFFDNLNDNVKLLYELMMQIFLQAYYRTKQFNSWITDQPVDYIAYKKSKYNLQHAKVNLNDLLKNENYNIGNEYTLLQVNPSTTDVMFINMNPDKDMIFYKISSQPDPVKNEGHISVYTSRHSVIHYKQAVIKKIESGLSISTEINETGLYITIHPCHSTQYRINTTQDLTLRIEDARLEYALCCKPGTTDIENDFVLVVAKNYTVADGIKIATIKVINKYDTKTLDIRIDGGGLPLDSEPDYNMLDIGHISGRPYRIGSTLLVRLPIRLKEHDKKIKQTLENHSSSGDYIVVIYE